MKGFVVGTRFFEKDESKVEKSLADLRTFCRNAWQAGAEHVFVAVNEAANVFGALEMGTPDAVTIFPVKPWGHFVQPLNALLLMGRGYWGQGHYFLSASVTVKLTPQIALALTTNVDDHTLVAGAAMEGHLFEEGCYHRYGPTAGRQVPWNTLALWNAEMLWKHGGFPLLGDGPPAEPENAGVEEVATIATVQGEMLKPGFKLALKKLEAEEWANVWAEKIQKFVK